MLLLKTAGRELRRLVHPRSVSVVKLEGKRVEENTVGSTAAYFILYFCLLAVAFLAISWESFTLETNLTAVITCLNNAGPGLKEVGPAGNFSCYSSFSQLILTLNMLFGRLEIMPMMILFSPFTWKKIFEQKKRSKKRYLRHLKKRGETNSTQ
jgi:trk system potassium uptake protein TrkH